MFYASCNKVIDTLIGCVLCNGEYDGFDINFSIIFVFAFVNGVFGPDVFLASYRLGLIS